MCAGCMGTADFLLTGGMLSAASLRVASRRLRPGRPGRSAQGPVTEAEVAEFVERIQAGPSAGAPTAEADAGDGPPREAAPVGAERSAG